MNGFAIFCGTSGDSGIDPKRVAACGGDVACAVASVGQGEKLLTWGHGNGDIHVATQGKESYLVLSGYVAGTNSVAEFSSQAEAALWCLKKIDENSSARAIADLARDLRGSFGIFYRNIARNLTLCITDRVGSRPLWRRWESSGWIVSSHPTAIALSLPSPRLDAVALGAFLVYGGPVEPCRSIFENVAGSRPGTILGLGERGACRETRWYAFQHTPDLQRSLNDWIDVAAERLTRAAARLVRSSDSMAVFFSGGTDSRLAAAALKAAGGNPLLVTLGDSDNLEVKVARLAARALGLRHQTIVRDVHWYLRSFQSMVYEGGGNYVWIHGHFASAARAISNEFGIDTFVLGDLCEAFSKLCCSVDRAGERPWTSEEFADSFDSLRLPLYQPANRNLSLSLLNPDIRADVIQGLRGQIVGVYERIVSAASDPLIVADQCLRWDSVQTIPTYFMFLDLRSAVKERNVMFDPDVHELLERLPSHLRNERNLGARLIEKLAPRAAWVMNSNSMLPMRWPPAVHRLSRRVKPVLGKIRRALASNTYRTTGSWPKHSLLYVNDAEWRRTFEATLNQLDLYDDALFDRDAIRRCWRSFTLGESQRSADVERLVQIGVLSRMLLSHSSNPGDHHSSRSADTGAQRPAIE